jgi:hypothetical protein
MAHAATEGVAFGIPNSIIEDCAESGRGHVPLLPQLLISVMSIDVYRETLFAV